MDSLWYLWYDSLIVFILVNLGNNAFLMNLNRRRHFIALQMFMIILKALNYFLPWQVFLSDSFCPQHSFFISLNFSQWFWSVRNVRSSLHECELECGYKLLCITFYCLLLIFLISVWFLFFLFFSFLFFFIFLYLIRSLSCLFSLFLSFACAEF